MSEILNLNYNFKLLALKALNKAQTVQEACFLLGISQRTMHRWRKDFGLVWNERTRFWEEKNPKPVII